MSEQNQNQEGQKTIVSFIVGLLIGGLIVWMFSGTPAETPTETNGDSTPTEETNGDSDTDDTDDTDDAADTDTDDTSSSDSDTNESEPDTATETPTMEMGDGAVDVSDQPASASVALDSVTYPMSDGWIGVREYTNDRLGSLLGVARFSEGEGLVPEEIVLQRATEPGQEYAIVFYTAGPDTTFNLGVNTQVEGIFATFTAQ